MSECKAVGELLVSRAEGLLDDSVRLRVEAHLAVCETCRAEAAEVDAVVRGLSDPGLFSPREDMIWAMLPDRLAVRLAGASGRRSWLPVRFGRAAWPATLAAVLLLGAGVVRLSRNAAGPGTAAVAPPGNEAFVRRIENAYAREATARYLSGCQQLLVEFVRAEKPCEGDAVDVSQEVVRARALLQQKRLLDAEPDTSRVAQARDLCDDLESFLVDLSLAAGCESQKSIERMGHAIRTQQLLLRISVVQSEIS